MRVIKILALILVAGIITPKLLIAKKGRDDDKKKAYTFSHIKEIETTSVKNQANTGTCWSYATASFIESEMLRLNHGAHDVSEMFFVRMVYPQKAIKYLRYHGLANFSEGGQGHDVINVIRKYGFVPEQVYKGNTYNDEYHNHNELADILKGILDNSLKNKDNYTGKSMDVFNAALNIYLGQVPDTFMYNNKRYTPVSFAKQMGIDANNYVELCSYISYPFYERVDLEIPDNWSHDRYYNLPIDELMQIVNCAFDNNFSVNWDGDVSDHGFSYSNGIAIIPETDPNKMGDTERVKYEKLTVEKQIDMLYGFDKVVKEKTITQKDRQKTFDCYKTTDDHLMHLVGVANDQNNTKYYLTKNSWGHNSNDTGGYLYMSESYLRLNTVAIQVHIDAIPDAIKTKLGL